MRKIVEGDSHIEHLVPRNPNAGDPALTFVYENLLASCQQNLLRKDPRHCGMAKGEWYDRLLMVSPLDLGCEARLRYDADGEVVAADAADEGARETIERLNLRCERLKNLRKGAIDALFVEMDGDNDPGAWRKLAAALQERDANGRFAPFCVALLATIEEMLKRAPAQDGQA
jgi:uncharacterized protein (TIGR02646 family)